MTCPTDCGDTRCTICDTSTGLRVNGEPFCVFCESQRPYWGANVLNEKPGVFASWQEAWEVLRVWIAFAALCWAAIYMLIRW